MQLVRQAKWLAARSDRVLRVASDALASGLRQAQRFSWSSAASQVLSLLEEAAGQEASAQGLE